MKNWKSLVAVALMGTVGMATAQAGNYRPVQSTATSGVSTSTIARTTSSPMATNRPLSSTPSGTTAQNGETKSAFWYDPGYNAPFCGTPVVRCNTYCSPRYYFPASTGCGYGNYGGYSNYNYGTMYGPSYVNPGMPSFSAPINPVIPAVPNYTLPGSYYPNTLPGYAPSNWNVGYTPGLNGNWGSPVLPSPYYP